jgi:hypothetical protein
MCSVESCNKRKYITINGFNYCRSHNILGECLVQKADGTVCGCRAKRRIAGVDTCMRHVPASTATENCSICLEDVPEGTKLTKCGHYFHTKCLRDWQKRPNGESCPMCRTPLKRKSLETIRQLLVNMAIRTTSIEEFYEIIMTSFSPDEFVLVNLALA